MADAPSTETLAALLERLERSTRAGFEALNTRLDRLVTTEAHNSDLRRVDDRLAELAKDIADEREARAKEIASTQEQIQQMRVTVRWAVAGIIIPIVLVIAQIGYAVIGKG